MKASADFRMIEQIAMVIDPLDYKPMRGHENCEDCLALRASVVAKAVEILKIIRQPTPKMLRAAGKALSPDRRPTPKRISVKAKHGLRYRAMIDAAIEGASQ